MRLLSSRFVKVFNVLCLGILLVGTVSFNSRAAKPTLNVYSWAGYLPESVLREFTQESGIQVNYSTYDTNETLYTKLKMNPNSGYDVIVPSSYMVDRMIREGMLKPLDKTQLKGFKYLDSNFLNKAHDPNNQYSIPYLWGATGILVNSRYHQNTENFNAWSSLWQPCWKGKLLLLDDMREVFSIALLALGYSPNTQDPAIIRKAYLKLKELMVNVRVLSVEGVTSVYIDEDLSLGMGWSGDAYRIQKENAHVKFYYPKEGYILSIDSFVIPEKAGHVDYAYRFIDFLLRPDIAARISLQTGYASTNQAARQYLPDVVLDNRNIYPDSETLESGVIQQDVGAQSALYEKYWELLKIAC